MKHHDTGASLDETLGYGEKGHFRKISLTLPPDAYQRLIQESARRKIAGEPNRLISALLREAVTDYLRRLGPGSP
jgi:hypothetical protein